MVSKTYFERKVHELESVFEAETLSLVTTKAQESLNLRVASVHDPALGTFKLQTKAFGVQLPKDAEELRMRFETLVFAWNLLSLANAAERNRNPSLGLASAAPGWVSPREHRRTLHMFASGCIMRPGP